MNVKAGEYLLAVNGREVRPPENVYSFFEGLADKSIMLRVGPDPNGSGAREVNVVPVPDEARLRNLAWIEENRRKVDQMTGGKIAYIYMPDTASGGLTAFNRYFYAQIGKEAAIVDERFNGGGLLATDIAEILNRKLLSAASNRVGEPLVQPQGIFGPKVMIINERAGSGGDAMAWYFRRAGVGKLIGARTWGGLVGMAGAGANGWRFRRRPQFGHLQSPLGRVGSGKHRSPAGYRSRARPGTDSAGPRSAVGEGGGSHLGGTEDEPVSETSSSGVSELPPFGGAIDRHSNASPSSCASGESERPASSKLLRASR